MHKNVRRELNITELSCNLIYWNTVFSATSQSLSLAVKIPSVFISNKFTSYFWTLSYRNSFRKNTHNGWNCGQEYVRVWQKIDRKFWERSNEVPTYFATVQACFNSLVKVAQNSLLYMSFLRLTERARFFRLGTVLFEWLYQKWVACARQLALWLLLVARYDNNCVILNILEKICCSSSNSTQNSWVEY